MYKGPPYSKLAVPREIKGPSWMPPDLRAFYETHEGLGLNLVGEHPFRFCRLKEVKRYGLKGTSLVDMPGEEWKSFSGILFAASLWGDEIMYVLKAPGLKPGSILMCGADVEAGIHDGVLMLAESLSEWQSIIEANELHDPAIAYEGDVSKAQKQAQYQRLMEFNPLYKK